MRSKPLLALLSAGIWLVALAWLAAAFAGGYRIGPDRLDLFVIAVAMVTLGDFLEIDLRGGRSTPVSNAVVFAILVVLPPPGVVAVVVPAFFFAFVIRGRELGWGPRFRSSSRRLGNILIAAVVYDFLASAIPPFPVARGQLLSHVVAMGLSGSLYLVIDTGLSAAFISSAQRVPFSPVWVSQLQNLLPLHASFLSVSALIALAHGVLSQWAFVLFLLPLFAARYSFRRYASIHKTYAQTIRALSKVPEMAGYAPEGHSSRVADLARELARRHGLLDNQIEELEFAALLHDVGRISFDDPAQAPESTSGTRQGAKLAEASAVIVEKTPYLRGVAGLVRDYEKVHGESNFDMDDARAIAARILKISNAYVELTEDPGPALHPLGALHQLELSAGTVYDPELVKSLRAVLDAEGHLIAT